MSSRFLIAESVGTKIGLKVEKGWSTLDKLELEGGLELSKVKARVETPFQIQGMNGMGLAGVELHGLMGFTVLAKYKMNFDYTKNQMAWTPLLFNPLPPRPLAGGKVQTAGMDTMVTIIRLLTLFAGIGPPPPPQPRGFFGFELSEQDEQVTVVNVLAKSPAAEAGLKAGTTASSPAEGKGDSCRQRPAQAGQQDDRGQDPAIDDRTREKQTRVEDYRRPGVVRPHAAWR